MTLEYLYLAPLFIVGYMVAVDKNLADYLYLKLFRETVVNFQSAMLRYKLLAQLSYDRFILKRGVVPKKFFDMA